MRLKDCSLKDLHEGQLVFDNGQAAQYGGVIAEIRPTVGAEGSIVIRWNKAPGNVFNWPLYVRDDKIDVSEDVVVR